MINSPEDLAHTLCQALDDGKAVDVRALDVRALTVITDYMIVASGRSSRQVKALHDRVIERATTEDVRAIGVEGQREGNWVLIDFGDVIVHIMQPETRAFYQLEKLWEWHPASAQVDGDAVNAD